LVCFEISLSETAICLREHSDVPGVFDKFRAHSDVQLTVLLALDISGHLGIYTPPFDSILSQGGTGNKKGGKA